MSTAAPVRLPGNLNVNRRLSQWLRIASDGTVTITPGKVEIGQGIHTALAQIVADELDIALHRVRVAQPSTVHSANEGVTSGSLSVQDSGLALRQASAEARAIYLAAAAQRLGVADGALTVEDGTIAGPGNLRTSYWELADDALLAREACGEPQPKPAAARRLAGRAELRLDIPDKVFGTPRFVHDLVPAGLVHGRVLRPPGPAARLQQLDAASAQGLVGVLAVVRDGSFVGVVAQAERQADAALERLRRGAVWGQGEALPDAADLPAWLRAQPAETRLIAEHGNLDGVRPVRTVQRSYGRPYISHAALGTSCAIARWTGEKLEVWSHTQGIFNLRADLALVLRVAPEAITVTHAEGAGCYGHNGADDAALDAALLARAVPGRPVRVLWSRADELAWSPVGACAEIALEADLDAAGDIVGWRHDVWSNGHVSRPGRGKSPTLLAGYHLAEPFACLPSLDPPIAGGGGSERNAVPLYHFTAQRIRNHRLLTMPLRVSSLRTLGAYANVFAIESFMDELALLRGEDPLAFRLRHLQDARARAVLEAAAAKAGWAAWKPSEGCGHGIGFARYKNAGAYCAVVAEVEGGAEVRMRRLVCAVDVGEAVNPDGVVNQIEGGAIQAASWTLKEAVQFDTTRITSDSWETYPILRFSEVPEVEVVILDRPEDAPLGAGEAAHGPTAAAIANAIKSALGVRVRHLPATREAIIAATE